MAMDIKQLQTLVAIADQGSFSAAAKHLGTVQSNVSAHIARLEKHLGVALVDRASGALTPEGDVVVARARRIMHEIEDIDGEIHSLGGNATGESRIGTISTTARWLMPPLLNQMSRLHPDVRITVVEGVTSSLLPRVAAGELDGAVVHLPVSEAGLESVQLFAEDLLLLAHRKHPIARHTTITLEELAEHPILLAPLGTAHRRIVDRAAAAHGVVLKTQAEIDGVRLMTSLAFDGYGAAIVPASAIPVWLSGEFTRIAVPQLPRRVVGWVQRARPAPSRATLAVRDTARAVVERHGSRQPGVTVDIAPLVSRS